MVLAQGLERGEGRTAAVLAVEGKVFASEPGKKTRRLKMGEVLQPGSVVWTDKKSKADFFLRESGTTIRLMPSTDVIIERLDRTIENGVLKRNGVVFLKGGELLCFVRYVSPQSQLLIKTKNGAAPLSAKTLGNYRIGFEEQNLQAAAEHKHLDGKGGMISRTETGGGVLRSAVRGEEVTAAQLEKMLQEIDELHDSAAGGEQS